MDLQMVLSSLLKSKIWGFVKTHKLAIGTGVVFCGSVGGAFWAGRYSKPAQIKVQEHVVYQDRIKVEQQIVYKDRIVTKVIHDKSTDTKSHTEKTTTETDNKDGSKTITTKVVTDTGTQTKESSQKDSDTHISTNVNTNLSEDKKLDTKISVSEKNLPDWRATLSLGVDFDKVNINSILLNPTSSMVYGVSVERRLVGPVWIGLWGQSDKTGGLSLGIDW